MPRAWLALLAPLLWCACQANRPRLNPEPAVSSLLAEGRVFEAEATLRATGHAPLTYGELVLGRDNLPEAEALARTALHADPGNQRAQLLLARARERHGDFAAAVPVFEKWHDSIWLCRASLDANRPAEAACAALARQPALEAVSAYAAWLLRTGQSQAAETALRQALKRVPMTGPEIRTVSRLRYQLAIALRDQQRPAAAEAEFWRALAVQREVMGGSLYLADTVYALGAMKLDQGWPASFQPFLNEAYEIRARLLDAGDWRVAQARGARAACLSAERRFDEAAPDLRDAYEKVARARGPNAPETAQLRAWWEANAK